jgi:opacity protein-like surface antigen
MLKQAGVVVAALLMFTSAAVAQDNGRWEVSLSDGLTLSKQTSGNGTILTPTQGSVFVASVRLLLPAKSGLEVSFGHAKNSQKYASGSLDYRIESTITEFSGAYVFRPFETKKLRPFATVGMAALVFNPNSTLINDTAQSIGARRQTRPAVLYGGGVDYQFYSTLSLRLQYRGLAYSTPDFKVPNLFTGHRGHMAEPTVGLVVRF